ncbi:MAG TPA: hypothetical protein VEH62_12015 [Gemmatimonadales bacterium]|nr:hypothetical protein [Gemmatimonadales bacterium]
MPRRFYLVGHNPNSVAAAARCLEAGANALEPDVCFERNDFFVHERIPLVPDWILRLFRGSLTLRQYLDGLTAYLESTGRAGQLALIAFDLKPPYDYDLATLQQMVRDAFGGTFPGTAILFTAGDPAAMPWLAKLAPAPRTGVGVDGGATPEEVNDFFGGGTLRYTYADGTSVPLLPTTCWLGRIRRAIALRRTGARPGFSLVYAWTVNSTRSMTAFLESDVDGLITDRIEKLRHLLATKFADRYTLAAAGDDPFA